MLCKGYDQTSETRAGIENRMNRVTFPHIKYTWSLYHLMVIIVLNKTEQIEDVVLAITDSKYESLSSAEVMRDIYLSIGQAQVAIKTKKKIKGIKILTKIKKRVAKLEKINSKNYAHVLALIIALIEELRSNTDNAIVSMNTAVELAGENGFLHNEAVFSER